MPIAYSVFYHETTNGIAANLSTRGKPVLNTLNSTNNHFDLEDDLTAQVAQTSIIVNDCPFQAYTHSELSFLQRFLSGIICRSRPFASLTFTYLAFFSRKVKASRLSECQQRERLSSWMLKIMHAWKNFDLLTVKRYHLRIPFFKKRCPFYTHSLELCTSFNRCKCTVF